ncbi:methyltransferase domain-containing protein, partial [Desertihabitans aurantiacus]|uniref:methyltransferase domain-containing protein n=1 Tax=Desertihabitans aurantiacus TaxID=2282477 RepID=UPI0018E581B6
MGRRLEPDVVSTPWQHGRLTRFGPPQVLFGRSHEDERVELAAFGAPGRVCVIAGPGELAAACVAAGHRVTAVDINPHQLAYARRRLASAPPVRGSAEHLLTVGRTLLRAGAPGWRLG